jgi:hypothetical protein
MMDYNENVAASVLTIRQLKPPWLECAVVGDVMPCKRYKRQYSICTTFDSSFHSENVTYPAVILFAKWLCQF